MISLKELLEFWNMIDQQPTFTGDNSIVINETTLFRILKEWLEVNVSGGPWDVHAFLKENDAYPLFCYRVKFRDAKAEKPL